MKKTLLYCILACISFAVLYAIVIAPRQTIRIPEGWSFEAEYLGNLVYIDDSQKIPDKPLVNVYKRSMHVVEWSRSQAVIEDIFETRDVYSGKITWSSTVRFRVNPLNGMILSYPGHPEAAGAQYIMPRNSGKTAYRHFSYALWPYTLEFEREDMLAGMPVYVFSFSGLIDFTELTNQVNTTGSMQSLPSDIKILSFDYYNEIWVEPRTGEIVHMVDIDPGDYWVDANTGEKIKLVAIWSGATTGNTDLMLIERAKLHLFLLDFHHRWVPGILLGVGLIFFIVYFFNYFGFRKHSFRDQ